MTSPPYFNLEIYTTEQAQSYHVHSEYEAWRNQWFIPLMEKGFFMLKREWLVLLECDELWKTESC